MALSASADSASALTLNDHHVQVAGDYEGATWDKFMMAPWIGNGSPINQTMWLDDLRIWSVGEAELVK